MPDDTISLQNRPSGKVAYPSPGAAVEALRQIRRRPKVRGRSRPESQHYRCDDCHTWHLTSSCDRVGRR